ncbi:MAG: ABC transporter permease [Anaerolineales bacterium]|nr:ABC transporter permease [Anaerolineales bacterium]
MSFRHLWAVIRKEIQHILRDRGTFILVLVTPTIVLLLMTYALAVDIQHVPIALLDNDKSATSRSYIQHITAGDDLDLYINVGSIEEIEELLTRGKIKAAVIIGPEFSEDLLTMRGFSLQIIIDGTEPESGGFAVEHIGWRTEAFVNEVLASQFQTRGVDLDSIQPIDLRIRAWYNPNLKPRVDLVPGLLSIVLGFPAFSVALTLAREHEHSTMEQLLASPITRIELLLGKMIPYILAGLLNVILIPLLAMAWFKVPFNGSILLFLALSVIFLFAELSMGMIIGVFMRSQSAALALSFLVVMFPGFFLTGIFFPTTSLPEMARMESLFLPGTHYAIITRGVFLTGIGIDVLWPYAVMLTFIGISFTAIAALFFKKRLA